jgi:hypothetical protein
MPGKNKNNSGKRQSAPAEPWEVEYVHQELPTQSSEEIERLVSKCKEEEPGLADRKKILKCVRRKASS